jgi:selenocysteine lyase/cysteine desulfurase
VLALVVLAAASNITGSALDMHEVNERVHRYGGVVCWDAAALAAHRKLDFNPVHRPSAYSDFAFVSAHKLLGAPGSPGILLAKKRYSPAAPAPNLPPLHSSLPLSPSPSPSLSL